MNQKQYDLMEQISSLLHDNEILKKNIIIKDLDIKKSNMVIHTLSMQKDYLKQHNTILEIALNGEKLKQEKIKEAINTIWWGRGSLIKSLFYDAMSEAKYIWLKSNLIQNASKEINPY